MLLLASSLTMSNLLKRITGFFLLLALSTATSVEARAFPDVPSSHKHFQAIDYLSNNDVIHGYPDGWFRPEGLINRAEAVKILTNSLFDHGLIESSLSWRHQMGHNYVQFPDVPIWTWYAKFVEVSFQNNVIEGYPDGTFKPADKINFAEALKVILESYKVDLSPSRYHQNLGNKLLILEPGAWYTKYFNYASEHNLINQNKVYHPGQLITRGEFSEVIYRLETMLVNGWNEYLGEEPLSSNEYTITIPRLGITNVTVSFADIYSPTAAFAVLKDGMGHYLNPPDARKKMVLFGHSSGYSWDPSNYKTLLREINRLQNGDLIYLNYHEKGYVYQVFRSEILPAAEDYTLVMNPDENVLSLYTCWPPNSIKERYVVYGKPV